MLTLCFRHIQVDQLGTCLQNKAPPVSGDMWFNIYGEAKMQILSEYHFCVSMENSRHTDYVTEKVSLQ